MMVFPCYSREGAERTAHFYAERFRLDVGVWEGGSSADYNAPYTVKVPAERKYGPCVDGAVYVALYGQPAEDR